MSNQHHDGVSKRSAPQHRVCGALAEFVSEEGIKAAAAGIRDAGFRRWDTHTPYPVHGLERSMGIPPSHVPWVCLSGGLFGFAASVLMQWWMNAYDYPYLISGKPLWSIPATIPVSFEMTVLFSAFGAFFGMLALNGLPRYYHFAFRSERFRRATSDRYFISIESEDPQFSPQKTLVLLEKLGAAHVELVEVTE